MSVTLFILFCPRVFGADQVKILSEGKEQFIQPTHSVVLRALVEGNLTLYHSDF